MSTRGNLVQMAPNLQVRRAIVQSDMSRCGGGGRLAERRPITGHYGAVTKQEAEICDSSSQQTGPSCELTNTASRGDRGSCEILLAQKSYDRNV